MKKVLFFTVILLMVFLLFGCTGGIGKNNKTPTENDSKEVLQQSDENDKKAIEKLVGDFGKKLQMVSLQAPKDKVTQAIREYYGNYVSPSLLSKWQANPEDAPGRMVSSPWPDRIEIASIKKLSANEYEVYGKIVEITSVEKVNNGVYARREVSILVKKFENGWLIDNLVLGSYEMALNSIVYRNEQYGFEFLLPKSWEGYSIITNEWKGLAIGDSQGEKVVEKGPLIYIRHPEWTSQNPRQDIPIMVFTIEQWNLLQQEKFHVGAAPFGPRELGRNSRYVFALPARYNYSYLKGYEEVDKILKNNSLKPIEVR